MLETSKWELATPRKRREKEMNSEVSVKAFIKKNAKKESFYLRIKFSCSIINDHNGLVRINVYFSKDNKFIVAIQFNEDGGYKLTKNSSHNQYYYFNLWFSNDVKKYIALYDLDREVPVIINKFPGYFCFSLEGIRKFLF